MATPCGSGSEPGFRTVSAGCEPWLSSIVERGSPKSTGLRATTSADRYLDDRPDFDGAEACHRNPSRDVDRLIAILGLDQEVPAQLLASFREWTVGHEFLVLTHANADRPRRGVQGGSREIVACRMQVVRELRRLHVTLLPLDIVEGLLVSVDQQHVFHSVASTLVHRP